MVYPSALELAELPDDNDTSSSSSSSTKVISAGSIALCLLSSNMVIRGHRLAVPIAWSVFSQVVMHLDTHHAIVQSQLPQLLGLHT